MLLDNLTNLNTNLIIKKVYQSVVSTRIDDALISVDWENKRRKYNHWKNVGYMMDIWWTLKNLKAITGDA